MCVTLEAIRARNLGAALIEPCARPPTIDEHAEFLAYSTQNEKTISSK
jgi:hypothetical protein